MYGNKQFKPSFKAKVVEFISSSVMSLNSLSAFLILVMTIHIAFWLIVYYLFFRSYEL